jgi:hypothetical protein
VRPTGEASANTPPPTSQSQSHEVFLGEEEISDVSLATFYVFDKENTGSPPAAQQLRLAAGCRGYGGCGCRACGGLGAEASEQSAQTAEIAEKGDGNIDAKFQHLSSCLGNLVVFADIGS